jgi:hypothetical protein
MTTSIATITKFIEVTPTISTSAYQAEDQVGGIQTLAAVAGDTDDNTVSLQTLTITDAGKQSAALVVYFFDDLPTVASVDNGAITITDAEMADKCLGHVVVAAADYGAIAANSVACVKNIGLRLRSNNISAATNSRSGNLYAVVKTTGTPTYVSTTDLVFKYSFDF